MLTRLVIGLLVGVLALSVTWSQPSEEILPPTTAAVTAAEALTLAATAEEVVKTDRGSSRAIIHRSPTPSRGSREEKVGCLPVTTEYYSVSSPYGYRQDPFTGERAWHSGIDLSAPGINKSPVYAVLDGKVTFAGSSGAYGYLVVITHPNGLTTKYAHLGAIAKSVIAGAKVVQGQVIGRVGSTGRSTGPHLHFEVLINNKNVNPKPYLDKWK